jgi:DNA (cytosine-5)-methyltransferase 1
MTYRLLDLYCCAGGCSMGYHRVGFDVTGIDLKPQPHYPFRFIQADAIDYCREYGHEYDAIHASPPCQAYSVTHAMHHRRPHPDLVAKTRDVLVSIGKPYIIENVVGAPLHSPLTLCGLMFGLKVLRHRLFETSFFMLSPYHPTHPDNITTNACRGYSSFSKGATHITMAGENFRRVDAITALNGDCSWMTRKELAQAIPPAYTEFIGRELIKFMETHK